MHFKKQKHNLITAIERKSRFLLIVNNPDGKNAKNVAARLGKAIKPFMPKSITLDNGLEFAQHQSLPSKTFFCDPYACDDMDDVVQRKFIWGKTVGC